MSYCKYCKDLPKENIHVNYHDFHYGFSLEDDNELFGRLILEINQAGLSWEIILKKEMNFRLAYNNFSIAHVSAYQAEDIERLLNDAGIIRNKLKIAAAVNNAKKISEIQKEFGTFKHWIDLHHPLTKEEWVKLFKKNFKFVGGEIVNEFLMSTGYLKGAHDESCPVFDTIKAELPKWMDK